jgi:hypothetical protein
VRRHSLAIGVGEAVGHHVEPGFELVVPTRMTA